MVEIYNKFMKINRRTFNIKKTISTLFKFLNNTKIDIRNIFNKTIIRKEKLNSINC